MGLKVTVYIRRWGKFWTKDTKRPRNPKATFVKPGAQSVGSKSRVLHGVSRSQQLHFHFSLSCIGGGNGNPFQCSCLENPRDGGAWGAAVYGVAQSRTRLKRLSSSSSSTRHNRGVDKNLSHPFGLIPGHTPTPIPYKEQACPHAGTKRAKELVFTPHCSSRDPNKALPEVLVWPLVNFY